MNINWKPNYIPGDLVYNHKGEVVRITSSYLKGNRLFYYKTDKIGESTGCILEEALKPVPLTPEILEKNGWEKEKYGLVYYKKVSETLYFRLIGKSYGWTLRCGNQNLIEKVEFIHQLQHLLFGLGLKSEMEV